MHPLDSVSPVRTKDGKIPTADGTLHPSHPRMTSGSGDHPPRPPSSASTASSASSSSSRHVRCIGRYVLLAETLGKGNFARVEAAVHTLTKSRVSRWGCDYIAVYFLFDLQFVYSCTRVLCVNSVSVYDCSQCLITVKPNCLSSPIQHSFSFNTTSSGPALLCPMIITTAHSKD